MAHGLITDTQKGFLSKLGAEQAQQAEEGACTENLLCKPEHILRACEAGLDGKACWGHQPSHKLVL